MSGISTATPAHAARRRTPLPVQPPGLVLGPASARPLRRVRHEVRDGVAVIVFSAVTSSGLAGLFTLLARLAS